MLWLCGCDTVVHLLQWTIPYLPVSADYSAYGEAVHVLNARFKSLWFAVDGMGNRDH